MPATRRNAPKRVQKIKQEDRVTDNGLKYNSFVRFNLSADEMKAKYPDHSLDEVYRIGYIGFGYEMSSGKCEVVLVNSQNERMGYVPANVVSAVETQ